MWVAKISVLLLAMLISVSVSEREYARPPPPPGLTLEGKLPEKMVHLDVNPELKKELEDLEKNGKSVKDECFGDYCFQVKQLQRRYSDYDCCCPTESVYYHPRPFTENRVTWYPMFSQWVRVGKCESTNKVCDNSPLPFPFLRKCSQLYQWRAFIFYRIGGFFQFRVKYFLLPDYCHCLPWFWRHPELGRKDQE